MASWSNIKSTQRNRLDFGENGRIGKQIRNLKNELRYYSLANRNSSGRRSCFFWTMAIRGLGFPRGKCLEKYCKTEGL